MRLNPMFLGPLLVLAFAPFGSVAADDLELAAKLRGSEEVPPVMTKTFGRAEFAVNQDLSRIDFEWQVRRAENILGEAGAHIHCGLRGENGPIAAFIGGIIDGGLRGKVRMSGTLTEQNVIATACGNDIAQLVDAMLAGETYVNIHSLDNPSGEVRGQIEPVSD